MAVDRIAVISYTGVPVHAVDTEQRVVQQEEVRCVRSENQNTEMVCQITTQIGKVTEIISG